MYKFSTQGRRRQAARACNCSAAARSCAKRCGPRSILAEKYRRVEQRLERHQLHGAAPRRPGCRRWNMLHPTEPPRTVVPRAERSPATKGPFIAASDYVRAVPEQIDPWVPGGLFALGTDGFGRSETRRAAAAALRGRRRAHRDRRADSAGGSKASSTAEARRPRSTTWASIRRKSTHLPCRSRLPGGTSNWFKSRRPVRSRPADGTYMASQATRQLAPHPSPLTFMDFKLPDLGENIDSGDIVSVLVNEGDVVKPHQDVIEIETDKAVIPVPASSAARSPRFTSSRGRRSKSARCCSRWKRPPPRRRRNRRPRRRRPRRSTKRRPKLLRSRRQRRPLRRKPSPPKLRRSRPLPQ